MGGLNSTFIIIIIIIIPLHVISLTSSNWAQCYIIEVKQMNMISYYRPMCCNFLCELQWLGVKLVSRIVFCLRR